VCEIDVVANYIIVLLGQIPHEMNYFLKILQKKGMTTTIDNGLIINKSHLSTMDSFCACLKQIELSQ
jgi:hypothetical protein